MEFDLHPCEKCGLSSDDFSESRLIILNARLLYGMLSN
jgi:hypothetical protein